jgi:hypothetical protein
VVSDKTSSAPAANDILIRVTPAATVAMPDDVLASLKDAASRLEASIQVTPSFACAKVIVNDCDVFVHCTGVTFG